MHETAPNSPYSITYTPATPAPQSTIHRQQRWVIPAFAARGTTLGTLQQALNDAKAAYHRSSDQVGGGSAEDAITVRLEGDALVIGFESRSGVDAS